MFNKYFGIAKLAVLAALSILLVVGCSSGGGDSAPVRVLEPISYSGSTTPVAISLENTPTLVTNVLYGGETASDVPVAVTITEASVQPAENTFNANRLKDLIHFSLDNIIGNATHGYNMPVAEVVNETEYCASGYYTVRGSLDDFTGMGTLTFDYYNCVLDGTTHDGMVHVTVHHIDYYNLNITMDFVLMKMSSSEFNISVSGPINLDESVSGNSLTEQFTQNHVEKDNNTGRMYKYENYIVTYFIYDVWSYSTGGNISFTGGPVAIMYDSRLGSLTVDTMLPLEFSSINRLYPDLGGHLVFNAGQSGIQQIVESSRHFRLELDLDGVAGYEIVRYVLWSELDDKATLVLADSDGDGMHDSWEESFGLDSSVDDAADDFDNDGMTNLEEYQQGNDPSI